MAIQLTNGAVFLHVPKTGGSWIERVLTDQGLVARHIGKRHAGWERTFHHGALANYSTSLIIRGWKQLFAGTDGRLEVERPFTFCFVRHPLDWYESWWRYMEAQGWRDWGKVDSIVDWHPCAVLNGTGNADFNTFVRNVMDRRPGFVSELYAQFEQPGIEFVGRFERLEDDLIHVLTKMNLDFDPQAIRSVGKVNASRNENNVEWDPILREEVLRVEWSAMVRYGYAR